MVAVSAGGVQVSIYGVTKYGEGLYGVDEDTSLLVWGLQIAWDGAYNGDNEGMRMRDEATMRMGRKTWVTSEGFKPYDDGEVTVVVDNNDNRFTSWWTTSPLYPYVRPGPLARFYVVDGRGGTSYPLMRGYVHDIQCFARGKDKLARIIIRDGFHWLADKKAVIGYHAGATTDTLIAELLTLVGWPFDEWPNGLGTGDTIAHYWGYDGNVLDEIRRLTNLSFGTPLHLRGDGTISNQTEADPVSIPETQCISITELSPWQSLYNHIEVAVYPTTLKTVTDTLWTIQDPIDLDAGDFVYFDVGALLSYGDYVHVGPDIDLDTVDFDYQVWTNANGTGTDLTADCPLSRSNNGIYFWIMNNGALDGWLTQFEVTGTFDIYVKPNQPGWKPSSDANSIALYGERNMRIDNVWQQTGLGAHTYASAMAGHFSASDLRMFELEVQLEARPAQQFPLWPGGMLVSLTHPVGVISPEVFYYRIGHITHQFAVKSGLGVRTTLKLERESIIS